ncbi:hypothetical protein FGG08_007718, partial [Glutinoglossum americanum]
IPLQSVGESPRPPLYPAGVEGQEDPALGLGEPLETIRVGKMEGDECIVALEEIGDGPRGNGDAPFAQGVMEFWETPVMSIA